MAVKRKKAKRPPQKFPSQRSRGLVDRALFWHLMVRTRGFHGPNHGAVVEAYRKQKTKALDARRRLLARLAELEALAHAKLGSHP